MYKKKIITIIISLFIFSTALLADVRTIEIKTNPVCENCKLRVEKACKSVKGVLKVKLNVETKLVSVLFDGKKTNPVKIKKTLSLAGYSADKIEANKKAREIVIVKCEQEKEAAEKEAANKKETEK